MSIFRMFNEYMEYKSREWEELLRYLFTDNEYTTEVGDDDLPF